MKKLYIENFTESKKRKVMITTATCDFCNEHDKQCFRPQNRWEDEGRDFDICADCIKQLCKAKGALE